MNDSDEPSSLTVLVLSDLGGDDRKLTRLLLELITKQQLVDCIFVTGSLTHGDPQQFNDTDYIAELLVKYKTVLQTLRQISPLVYFVQGANDPILTIKRLSLYTQAESMILGRYPDNNEWCVDVSFQAVRIAPNLVLAGSSGSSASLDSFTKDAYDNGADVLWSDTVEQELIGADNKSELAFSSSSSLSLLHSLLNFELQVSLLDVLQSTFAELNMLRAPPDMFIQTSTINTMQSVLKNIDPRFFYKTRTLDEIRALITYRHSAIPDSFKHRTVPRDCEACTCSSSEDHKQKQSQHPPYPFGPFFYPYVLYEGLDNFDSYTADALTLAIQYARSFNDYVVDMSANRDIFLTYSKRSAKWITTHVLPQLYESQSPIPVCSANATEQAPRKLRPVFASDTTTEHVNFPLHYLLETLQAHTAFHDEPMAIFIKFLLSPSLLNPTEVMYMRIYGPLFCYNVDSLPGSAFQKLLASSSAEPSHIVSSSAMYSDDEDTLSFSTPASNAMDDMLRKEWMMNYSVVAVRDGTSHDLHDLYKETCNIVDEFSSSSDASTSDMSTYIRSMSTHYAKSQSNLSSAAGSLASSFVDECATSAVDSSPIAKLSVPRSPALAPLTPLNKSRASFIPSNTIRNYASYLKTSGSKVALQDDSTYLTKSLSVLPGLNNSALIKDESQNKIEAMRGWLKLAPNLYDRLPKLWIDWSRFMQSTGNELSKLYSFNASRDSVILLTHQGPAGSPTSYEIDRDRGGLLETGSYSLRELYCEKLNLLLHVHGRARKPLVRLYEVDDVVVFNPGTFRDGLYGILEIKRKAGIWQLSSASVHKLAAEVGAI